MGLLEAVRRLVGVLEDQNGPWPRAPGEQLMAVISLSLILKLGLL